VTLIYDLSLPKWLSVAHESGKYFIQVCHFYELPPWIYGSKLGGQKIGTEGRTVPFHNMAPVVVHSDS